VDIGGLEDDQLSAARAVGSTGENRAPSTGGYSTRIFSSLTP